MVLSKPDFTETLDCIIKAYFPGFRAKSEDTNSNEEQTLGYTFIRRTSTETTLSTAVSLVGDQFGISSFAVGTLVDIERTFNNILAATIEVALERHEATPSDQKVGKSHADQTVAHSLQE